MAEAKASKLLDAPADRVSNKPAADARPKRVGLFLVGHRGGDRHSLLTEEPNLNGKIQRLGKRIAEASSGRSLTVVLVLIVAVVSGSIASYILDWKWTGLSGTTQNGPKTLWHWLELLTVPVVLAAAAAWLGKAGAESAALVEENRAQDAALETYFDRMSELLLDEDDPLLASKVGSACQEIAYTRTVTVIRRLDQKRRNLVFDFLRVARLLGIKAYRTVGTEDREQKLENHPVAIFEARDMRGMDLRGAGLQGVNLRLADLSATNLQGADLREADLREAELRDANLRAAHLNAALLRGADLQGADLLSSDLREADLQLADLRKTSNLTHAQLKQAKHWENAFLDQD